MKKSVEYKDENGNFYKFNPLSRSLGDEQTGYVESMGFRCLYGWIDGTYQSVGEYVANLFHADAYIRYTDLTLWIVDTAEGGWGDRINLTTGKRTPGAPVPDGKELVRVGG